VISRNTTIVLAVIALGLSLWVGLVETGLLTSGELDARRGRVIERFVRPRVEDVIIEREGEGAIALHRERAEDLDALELGHWTITEPVAVDADQDAVDQLLGSLEYLEARRTLEGIDDADRQTFGLVAPRARVRFTVAGDQVTVSVGGDDPRGQGVYVAVDDRPTHAWIVGRDFLEALEHDLAHFRRKELFRAFRGLDASAIELTNAGGTASLERRDGRWFLTAPTEGLARVSTVDELFSVIADVRATRFLAEEAGDLGEHGLATPSREIRIRRERTDRETETERDDGEDRRSPIRLRIGGVCPGHETEVIALPGETGPLVCVEAASIAELDLALERLRESRLSAIRDDELDRAEIAVPGAALELRRREGSWEIVNGQTTTAADAQAIEDWLSAIRASEATSWEPASDERLRARGLSAPRATITLHRAEEGRSEALRLGASDPTGVWIRRGDEPQIGLYPAAAAALLAPSAIRFRDRTLVRDVEGNARRITITREGQPEERVEREGTEWRVRAPIDVAADRVVVRDVARGLASLAAIRFVADRAESAHGLERPRIVVSARFEGALPSDEEEGEEHDHDHASEAPAEPREIVLRIGAPTDDGAFATFGEDPAVFVIAPDLVTALEGPLASRDLLAVETSEIETLTIVRGGERIALRREGDGWTAGTGLADEARTTLIHDRLASLRATGATHYGPATSDEGMSSPTVALEIARRRGEPASVRLEIGAVGAPGEDGWYHARRSDLAVGYRVSAALVRAFLDYAP
jgi:hypothetical protein